MTGCHDCPVAEAIAKGEYANTAWAEIPCSTCNVADGGYAIEYDDSRPGAADSSAGQLEEETSTMLPLDVMTEVLKGLLLLPPEQRDTVAMRYSGMRYPEIAARLGVSTACVEKRHRTAMKRWPMLRELFPLKAAKQKTRKAHKARMQRGRA